MGGKRTHKENVPVTFNGELVGRAVVYESGVVQIALGNSKKAEDLANLMMGDALKGITLGTEVTKLRSEK